MHYLQYKEDHVSYLEREIQRLRAEIDVLHEAQDQLAEQISEARKDAQDLKVQKQKLEQHNKALEGHKDQVQVLCEGKAQEAGTMADQIRELLAASQSLLAENALLKFLVVSLEAKNKAKLESEKQDNLEDGTRLASEGSSDIATTEGSVTLDYSKENKTDWTFLLEIFGKLIYTDFLTVNKIFFRWVENNFIFVFLVLKGKLHSRTGAQIYFWSEGQIAMLYHFQRVH